MKADLRNLKNDFGLFVPLIAMLFFGFTFWILNHENRLSEQPKLVDFVNLQKIDLNEIENKESINKIEELMKKIQISKIQCTSIPDNSINSQRELSLIVSSERSIPILPNCPSIEGIFSLWRVDLIEGKVAIAYASKGNINNNLQILINNVTEYILTQINQELSNEQFRETEAQSLPLLIQEDAKSAQRRLLLDEKLKN